MSARPQITITLGQTGQVVKRATTTVDVSSSDYHPSSEGKRSIRERLGNNIDGHHENGHSKRQRTDNYNLSNGHRDDERQRMSNGRVSRNDLRHKLMIKGLSRGKIGSEEQNGMDLREKLSRSSRIPLRYESNQNSLESRVSSLYRRIPPARTDDLLRLDSSRKSHSLTLDGQRYRSPEGLIGAYRRMSPPRSYDEVYNNPLIRPYGNSRLTGHSTRSIADTSRPAAIVSKAIPVDAATKSILRAPPGVAQKPLYLSEVPVTVAGLLHSLGLGKYAIPFQAEEVDMAALRQMGDKDLKELGIPMGPRKKILQALLQRSKHRLH